MDDDELGGNQRRRLDATVAWAHRLRATLGPLLERHGDRVHFRPSSTGVAMIGLVPDRPQRGKGGLTNLHAVVADFEALFARHCRDIDHGRVTGEKALQSFFLREAYLHGRHMVPINEASQATTDPVDMLFVTDEIALPLRDGKIVCDVLALRCDGGRSTPVLIELKDKRMLTRLVEQLDGFAALLDEHADRFASLFGALLGRDVRFDGLAERWLVWPAAGPGPDPRESELASKGIRVVGYEEHDGAYVMRVGRPPLRR
jgi:hypothetical protein